MLPCFSVSFPGSTSDAQRQVLFIPFSLCVFWYLLCPVWCLKESWCLEHVRHTHGWKEASGKKQVWYNHFLVPPFSHCFGKCALLTSQVLEESTFKRPKFYRHKIYYYYWCYLESRLSKWEGILLCTAKHWAKQECHWAQLSVPSLFLPLLCPVSRRAWQLALWPRKQNGKRSPAKPGPRGSGGLWNLDQITWSLSLKVLRCGVGMLKLGLWCSGECWVWSALTITPGMPGV